MKLIFDKAEVQQIWKEAFNPNLGFREMGKQQARWFLDVGNVDAMLGYQSPGQVVTKINKKKYLVTKYFSLASEPENRYITSVAIHEKTNGHRVLKTLHKIQNAQVLMWQDSRADSEREKAREALLLVQAVLSIGEKAILSCRANKRGLAAIETSLKASVHVILSGSSSVHSEIERLRRLLMRMNKKMAA